MSKNIGCPIKIKGYEDNCPICYELWNESNPWTFQCGHMICEKCYLKQRLVNRSCHICREKYNLKKKKNKRKYKNTGYSSESGSWNYRDEWNEWD